MPNGPCQRGLIARRMPVIVAASNSGQNPALGGGMVGLALCSMLFSFLTLVAEAQEPVPADIEFPSVPAESLPLPLPAPAEAMTDIPPLFDESPVAPENPETFADLAQGFETTSNPITVMTADEKWKLIISGALVGETIFSTQRITSPGSYLFVNPYLGRDSPGVEVQGRSTSLSATLIGPEMIGLRSGGQMAIYLYGQSPFANLYGVFFALAYGELKNDDWRFEFGLGPDVINPLNPTTLNFGYGLDAGNTGFIRGHFRSERYLRFDDEFQITLQSSIGQPVITEYAAPFPGSDITLGETNGWPNIEGRVAFGFGTSENRYGSTMPSRRIELGLSGVIGQVRTSSARTRILATTAGVGVDLTANVTDRFGMKGEFYKGQAMGSYFGGSGQSVNLDTFEAIRAQGGWAEAWFYLTPKLHTHWGGGIDAPLQGDVGINQRQRNQFVFGNLIWDVNRSLQLGFEVSRYATDWNLINIPSTHAYIFHTRVALKF